MAIAEEPGVIMMIGNHQSDDELGEEVDPFDLLYEADDEDEDP